MKFSISSLAVVALATQTVVAEGWFGGARKFPQCPSLPHSVNIVSLESCRVRDQSMAFAQNCSR